VDLVRRYHSLTDAGRVSGPSKKISVAEVKGAIAKMKINKAADLFEVISDMLKASGEGR